MVTSKSMPTRASRAPLLAGLILIAGSLGALDSHAAAAGWTPVKNVEIIAAAAPGGGLDLLARHIQKAWQDNKIVDVPVTVINKPGGGGALAWNYLNQHSGDGHYLAGTAPPLLTGNLTGISPTTLSDITPIALLLIENAVFSVRADAPSKSGKDLTNALRKSPGALVIALAPGLGHQDHIALGLVAAAAGIDSKALKIVIFNSGGEALAALLGGHVDLHVGPATIVAQSMEAGKLRAIGVAAAQRLKGAFASVPTWKEQGFDVVMDSWRGLIGPKSMTPAQVTYWEAACAKLVDTKEWQDALDKNMWERKFLRSTEMTEFLRAQKEQFRKTLTDLGIMAK